MPGPAMKRSLRKLLAVLLAPFPSALKVFLLNQMGHKISNTAHIGLSILDIKLIEMGPGTYIGPGNIFTNLEKLEMKNGSRINRWNRITSNGSKTSILRICERSSISMRHYFDVCNLVEIGHDTIIAGHRSTFFTHSKGIKEIDYTKPIIIGSWCYLGSDLKVAPGTQVGRNCFVGMGSVLVGDSSDQEYALLAGNPARLKQKIQKDCTYYQQEALVHEHHRKRKNISAPMS